MFLQLDVIFALLNFFIFSVLCIVLFKRSLLPILTNQYQQELHEKDLLIQRMHALKEQRSHLEMRIQDEERSFEELSQKVRIWRESSKLKQEEAALRHTLLRSQLEEAERNKVCYYEAEKIHKLIKADALIQAEKNLRETYSDRLLNQAYTKVALTNLKSKAYE